MTTRWLFGAVLLICSVASLSWSGIEAYHAKASARESEKALLECRMLADQILLQRGQESRATLTPLTPTDLADAVHEAVADVQIPPKALRAISPLPPVRSESGSYRIESTDVAVDDLRLAQVLQILERLGIKAPRVQITGITISPSPVKAKLPTVELWRVQIRLTQVVYVPITRVLSTFP